MTIRLKGLLEFMGIHMSLQLEITPHTETRKIVVEDKPTNLLNLMKRSDEFDKKEVDKASDNLKRASSL